MEDFKQWRNYVHTSNHHNQQVNNEEEEAEPQHNNHYEAFFDKLFRLFDFQTYMIFWIPKNFFLLLIECIRRFVFFIFVKPIITIWARLSSGNDDVQLNFSWSSVLLPLLIAISSLYFTTIYFTTHNEEHSQMPSVITFPSLRAFMASPSLPFQTNDHDTTQREFEEAEAIAFNSLQKLSDIIQQLSDDNKKTQKALFGETKIIQDKISNLQSGLEAKIKNIWSRLTEQQSQIESTEKELYKGLESRQSEYEIKNQDMLSVFAENLRRDIDLAIDRFQSSQVVIARVREQDGDDTLRFSTQAFAELLHNSLIGDGDKKSDATTFLESIIDKSIQSYHQDVLNSADFALKSRGAQILKNKTSETYFRLPIWRQIFRYSFGLNSFTTFANLPDMAISPQTHAGECWSMYGDKGNLGIVLSEPIQIQGITVEHPSRQIMFDSIKNAPKEMEVYGVLYSTQLKKEETCYLGSIAYDIYEKDSKTIQTFEINRAEFSDMVFQAVQIKILSNWGNPEYTDIYRIRIHGNLPPKK